MTAGPWSVKGIDPKAREVAKDLARRSGLTLGEWLNQMIIEGEGEGPLPETTRVPEARPRAAVFPDRDRGFAGSQDRDAGGERGGAPRSLDAQRLARAIEHLTARVEAAESRSTRAISGVDESVTGLLLRLDGLEREQAQIAQRFETAREEARLAQGQTRERLQRLVQEEEPRREALTRIAAAVEDLRSETAAQASRVAAVAERAEATPLGLAERLGELAHRLEQVEGGAAEAARSLQTSFAGLDARLRLAEALPAPGAADEGLDQRLERLSADFAARLEEQRRELAEKLREIRGESVSEMEAKLGALSGEVEAAERRSAATIERMGREVLKVATSLGDRVRQAESRSAQAAQQVSEQMSRVAGALEGRLRGQEAAQAEALERLGSEISKIAEKLTERILGADKRAAQAIDDVGDQLGRVTERLNQRVERSASELAERIRQSEERTSKILEEAQSRLEERLSESQRRVSLEAAAAAARTAAAEFDGGLETPRSAAPAAAFAAPPHEFDASDDPFAAPSPFGHRAGTAGAAAAPDPFAADPFAPSEPRTAARAATPFDEGALPAPAAAAPAAEIEEDAFESVFADPPSKAPSAGPARPASTREMIEQARAAARRASEPDVPSPRRHERSAGIELPPLEASGGLSMPFLRKKKRDDAAVRTALVASGTAAALAFTAVGAVTFVSSEMAPAAKDKGPDRFGVAPTAAPAPSAAPAAAGPTPALAEAPPPPPAETSPATSRPSEAAMALSTPPSPAAPPALPPDLSPPPGASTTLAAADPSPLYSQAVRRLEGGDPRGVEDLKRVAAGGYAPAQFYLAELYERGRSGVPKDMVLARRWTERAAEGGDPNAMHNLGLYLYQGEGGASDPAQAVRWFRKAAEAGVRDSQFNLALLYAKGEGAPQNDAEAYKWYLISAAQGDEEARAAAKALRSRLSPEAEIAAERAAAAFHARTASYALASTPTR